MKYFTFVLLAILIVSAAMPIEYASARRSSDDSHQEDSQSEYDDDDDEYEDGNDDSDGEDDNEYEDTDDSYSKSNISTQSIVNMSSKERLTLLQELLVRIIALMNELKNMSTTTTPASTAPVTSSPAKTYTVADVATHNTTASCWSIIDSKVYDLTSYITRHPGGSQNIKRICGEDGTSTFSGQHGGESKPERTLAGFYLAPLAK